MTEDEIRGALAKGDRFDVCSALIEIGKCGLFQFRSELEGHLNSSDAEVRGAAIKAAAFHWRLPEYREVASNMMENEVDPLSRSFAVTAWSMYYAGSNDIAAISRLRNLLYDRSLPWEIRDAAYGGLLVIGGIDHRRLPWKHLFPDSEESVDWQIVEEILAAVGIDEK